ncbi:MAG TPA: protein translocase subunit SecD [Gammaproteobacteria bacterium]|nr:protein translocase subunit SecD [Gammaproteobacteria bacterium]
MPTPFPRWKTYLLLGILLIGFVYAIPNLYGEDPAVQISGLKGQSINAETTASVTHLLKEASLQPKSIAIEKEGALLVRFSNAESQLKAKDVIKKSLKENYSVALNLAPVTPHWLSAIGAKPMKLGLDLRGGVHFLMEVDVDSVVARRMEGYFSEMPKVLREAKIHYKQLERPGAETIKVFFESVDKRNDAYSVLKKWEQDLAISTGEIPPSLPMEGRANKEGIGSEASFFLVASLSPQALLTIRNETLDQTLSILRNRVNELGVAEAIVQRQGLSRVVVELPGIQDTAYARDILGTTATLKFVMEDHQHPLQDVLSGHSIVVGSKLYFDRFQRPVLLKTQPILTGEAVTGASTGQGREGEPTVSVRLGGNISLFSKTTRDNVGRRMGVIYIEVKDHKTTESVISLATIQSALGNNFQITGLSIEESRDLALLLRAGALPAPVSIVEESIIGPSMGQENIRMGMVSVAVGLGLVLVFMAIYYSVFGIIADIALLANLVLLVAIMSLIGATLTLPGIAGIVLTLGMAVDANVLIFERIREEMRLGMSPKASIFRGFEYAFATIIDSNLTTLIVGVVLFAIGSGPIKGFAVTLCIGILTSLLTSTTGSRALVELLYGGRSIKRVRVGI